MYCLSVLFVRLSEDVIYGSPSSRHLLKMWQYLLLLTRLSLLGDIPKTFTNSRVSPYFTAWGGRLSKRFCKQISKRSPCSANEIIRHQNVAGIKFLWWTWHDTDAPIDYRILGVPIGSTVWVITFTGGLTLLSNQ